MADSDEKQQALNTANFAIYVLSVTVIEAKQLRAADMNGKSDPFVKCRVIGTNNKELGGFKTKVIEANNKNPKWDKFHVFSLFDKPVSVVFEVWDQDESAFGGKDDELGQATIDLNTYFGDGNGNGGKGDEMVSQLSETPQINEQWYVLDKIKKHKGEGCIKLTVKAERLVPLQTEKKLKSIKMELDNVQSEKMKQETVLNNKIKQLEGTVSKIETEKQDLLKQNNELKSKGARAPAPTESKDEEETSSPSSNDLNLEITRLQGELAKNNNKINKLNQEYNELQVSYEKLKNSNNNTGKTESSNTTTSGNGAVSANETETETEMKREIVNKNNEIEELNARVKELESRNKSTNNSGEDGQKKEQAGPDMLGQIWRVVLAFSAGIGIGVWYTNQSFSQS